MTILYEKYYLLLALSILCVQVDALEPKWPEKSITINAQEESLPGFLKIFFSNHNMNVVISKKVNANISGNFTERPEKVFSDIVKAYNLLPYYDGHAMHISLSEEVESRSIKVNKSKINKIISELSTQNLMNDHQSVQVLSKQGLVKVRGAKQFVYDIQELIDNIQGKKIKATKAKYSYQKVLKRPAVIKEKNEMVFKTFSLKYASAADVTFYQNGKEILIPGVATLLTKMVGGGSSLSSSKVHVGRPERFNVPGLRGKGLRRFQADKSNDNYQQVNSVQTQHNFDKNLREDTVNVARASATDRSSMAIIEAERNLNAVIIRDYADAMPLYENLILQLDKEPQLIEIQVTIIDVDKNKLKDIGFDWRYEGNRNSARFGGGDPVDFQGENGGLLLNTVIGDPRRLFASIRALAEKGSARVVSQPQVITVSNLEAVLQNDQSFYIRVAGNEEVDLFNVTAGTSLRVLPHIVGDLNDPKIRMLITIEDGVIVPDTSVDDIPIVERSTLSTQAIIYDGENLLLGGLVRESSSKNVSKVPLLGDAPVVGNLFKRTNQVESRTERLFLISPRIVSNKRSEPEPQGASYRRLASLAEREKGSIEKPLALPRSHTSQPLMPYIPKRKTKFLGEVTDEPGS